jgi:imidazolonepropionase-like amidohydrolase
MRRVLLSLSVWLVATSASGQIPGTAPTEGLHDRSPQVHALVDARIVVSPGKVIPRGTLVVRDGLIVAAGEGVAVPAGARVWNLAGRTVYPGFIDSYAHLDLPAELQPKPEREEDEGDQKPAVAKKKPTGAGAWNARITPERSAADSLSVDGKQTEKWRSLGFTSALVVSGRGIFRGTSALINLGGTDANRTILRPRVAQHVAFEQSGFREDSYPGSLMGTIALIRQTLLDADWYARAQTASAKQPESVRPETNAALHSLEAVAAGREAVVFETGDELDLARALRLGEEFRLASWLRGSGYEYRRLDALKKSRAPVILPLAFPEVPEVETAEKALDVDLETLQHWEQAPSNPARLAKAGIAFALSTEKLAKPEETFWPRLRKAVARGLSEADALEALTVTPAKLFGVSGRYGTLEPGKVANLVVADGNLFTHKANVLAVWVDGRIYPTEKFYETDLRGIWTVRWSGGKGPESLRVSGEAGKPKATLGSSEATAALSGDDLVLLVPGSAFGQGTGIARLGAVLAGDTLEGTAQLPDGQLLAWTAKRTASESAPTEKVAAEGAVSEFGAYPAGAFGLAGSPAQPEWLLVRGATIWTSGPQGRLEGADLLVHRGKVERVGRNLDAPAGAVVIDGQGKHVTPGLIDAHSHTAISLGVNEATHANTAEVRIGDVLDPTDIGIYRELAGGLTVANVLHGSANPIGGQNQVIKLRWGADGEGLKFAGAPAGIKFALGENVKQSNWGDRYTTRYPKTRMGVEQFIRDAFLSARDYQGMLGRPGAIPVRRDLQMEALVEILQGKRLIHAHSYRQDEILMLTRVARDLDFRVATFQHVLEGYKVADALAEIGAGGSSFSDWWGYKLEVVDAIPYNGALMHGAGVLVSFNSDSDELARRLNTEAAKAVKYGGLDPVEALKFVTINPARQLGIERQVGSLEPGKDADFVVWSGSPLSSYSRAEQTWIDGRAYFDLARDREARAQAERKREALIQKALPERQKALSAGKSADKTPSKPVDPRSLDYAKEFHSPYHDGGSTHAYTDGDGHEP